MPQEVERYPGGGRILHVLRRPTFKKCHYCDAPHNYLCDFKLPNGKTCDRPMCFRHTHRGAEPNTDFCHKHAKGGAR